MSNYAMNDYEIIKVEELRRSIEQKKVRIAKRQKHLRVLKEVLYNEARFRQEPWDAIHVFTREQKTLEADFAIFEQETLKQIRSIENGFNQEVAHCAEESKNE